MSDVTGTRRDEMSRRSVLATGVLIVTGGLAVSRQDTAALRNQASPEVMKPGSDWSMSGGNPARTGLSEDTGPMGDPVLLWRYSPGRSLMTSALIVEGVVYVTAGLLGEGSVGALDLDSGRYLWSLPIGFQPFGSTPIISGDVMYIAGNAGDIAAVQVRNCEILWATALDAGTSSSPIVIDDVLYIGADDDHLYALDIADGSERWRFSVGVGNGYTLGPSPAFADGVVLCSYAGDDEGPALFAIDATSGSEIWQMVPDESGLFSPAVDDSSVYVGGEGGDVYTLDLATGDRIWKTQVGRTWSAPAITERTVLFQTMSGTMVALDRESGDVLWLADIPATWCGPIVAADTAYVGADGLWFQQGLYAVGLETGQLRWHMRTGGVTTSVSISGDVLVVTDDGAVCAIGGSSGTPVKRGTNGAGAFLTPLVFSTMVDDDAQPVDPGDVFPAGISELIASFDHVGLKYESAWEARWTLNGEPLAARTEVWHGGTERMTEIIFADQGSLPIGTYILELLNDGEPIRRGEVIVG